MHSQLVKFPVEGLEVQPPWHGERYLKQGELDISIYQELHDGVGATDGVKGEVRTITNCSAVRLHSCDGCAGRDARVGRTRAGHHERWQQWEGEDANADEEQDDPVPRQLEPLDGPASEEGAEAPSRHDDQTNDLRGQPVGESVLLLHELRHKGGVAVDDCCVTTACN